MKKYFLSFTLIISTFSVALPWMEAPNTDYEVKISPNVILYTAVGASISNQLINAPFGGYKTSYSNLVIIGFFGANGGACKIRPASKAGKGLPLAVLVKDGMPKTIMIDGGKDNKSELLYVYAEGNLKKLKIKGFASVGKIAISNNNDGTGVTIQNATKPSAGGAAGNVHSVIVNGKLKKLQSNKGGFGGTSPTDTGVISIEGDSPKGIIKSGPSAQMPYLLFCGGLVNGGYDFSAAYNHCWAMQQVDQAVVKMGSIKKLITKDIGPAIFGLNVEKKYKDATKLKITDVVGMENFVE